MSIQSNYSKVCPFSPPKKGHLPGLDRPCEATFFIDNHIVNAGGLNADPPVFNSNGRQPRAWRSAARTQEWTQQLDKTYTCGTVPVGGPPLSPIISPSVCHYLGVTICPQPLRAFPSPLSIKAHTQAQTPSPSSHKHKPTREGGA